MLVAKLLLVLTHASLASCWILQFRPTQAEESVHRMTLLPRAASIRVMADSLGDVEPAMMRAAEIKAELKERQIDFSDCFDKESLADKLDKARAGLIGPTPPPPPASSPAPPPTVAAPEPSTDHVDPESFRAEVMAMRASQIKAELQERRILFTDCFDKESLADKLCQARARVDQPDSGAAPTPTRPVHVAQHVVPATALKRGRARMITCRWRRHSRQRAGQETKERTRPRSIRLAPLDSTAILATSTGIRSGSRGAAVTAERPRHDGGDSRCHRGIPRARMRCVVACILK